MQTALNWVALFRFAHSAQAQPRHPFALTQLAQWPSFLNTHGPYNEFTLIPPYKPSCVHACFPHAGQGANSQGSDGGGRRVVHGAAFYPRRRPLMRPTQVSRVSCRMAGSSTAWRRMAQLGRDWKGLGKGKQGGSQLTPSHVQLTSKRHSTAWLGCVTQSALARQLLILLRQCVTLHGTK